MSCEKKSFIPQYQEEYRLLYYGFTKKETNQFITLKNIIVNKWFHRQICDIEVLRWIVYTTNPLHPLFSFLPSCNCGMIHVLDLFCLFEKRLRSVRLLRRQIRTYRNIIFIQQFVQRRYIIAPITYIPGIGVKYHESFNRWILNIKLLSIFE